METPNTSHDSSNVEDTNTAPLPDFAAVNADSPLHSDMSERVDLPPPLLQGQVLTEGGEEDESDQEISLGELAEKYKLRDAESPQAPSPRRMRKGYLAALVLSTSVAVLALFEENSKNWISERIGAVYQSATADAPSQQDTPAQGVSPETRLNTAIAGLQMSISVVDGQLEVLESIATPTDEYELSDYQGEIERKMSQYGFSPNVLRGYVQDSFDALTDSHQTETQKVVTATQHAYRSIFGTKKKNAEAVLRILSAQE